jgi:hypothetical protein
MVSRVLAQVVEDLCILQNGVGSLSQIQKFIELPLNESFEDVVHSKGGSELVPGDDMISSRLNTDTPVTPSSSQAHPWMRRELLVPVGPPFSTPNADPSRNLAGNGSAPSSPTSQGHICDDFKSSKGLAARFQSPPPQFKSCELQKYVENCRKFIKMPNQFCLNP